MRAEPCFLNVSPLSQAFTCILLFLSFLPSTFGLYVVTGSTCTAACASNSTGSAYITNTTDLTCHDTDYSATDAGRGFQSCVACELHKPTFEHATSQTDIGWALFNIRYTLSSCIFNYSENDGNNNTEPVPQCVDSCSKLSDSLETNLATPQNATTYDYCQNSTFLSNVDACASCYDLVQNQRYISNFLNVLEYACQFRPNTSEAFPIPASAIFTLSPPTNYSGYSSNNDAPAGGLNAETKTAIAITVPVCFFLIFTIILVCCYTHKHTKNLPPPSRTHSKRSAGHLSKSTDTEKGWSHVSRSPPKHGFSEKRSTTRSTHRHSRGRPNHSRSNTGQTAASRPENIPIPQPLRTRSAHSQLGALYQQARTSPKAPNPTTDTLATTYTTPSESLHSIPILVPAHYEPPVPTLGPSPRWDDEPVAPTLLPPLRSSPSSRSGPPSRSGLASRSAPPSRSGLQARSGPPSRSAPSPQSGPSSHHSPLHPDSPSKRPPTLPPPSRWESPQTRNLPPLSRYTSQQPHSAPLPPRSHYDEPPRESSVPPPETFQPAPPRSLPLQIPNTQPMEEAGPSEQQLQTLQSLPPPLPSATPTVTSTYNPTGLVNWEHTALKHARSQDTVSSTSGDTSLSPVSPISPFTALPSFSGEVFGSGTGSGLRRTRSVSSRRSHFTSTPKPEPSSTSSTRPSISTGRPLSRIPSAEEPPSRPSTAGNQQTSMDRRPGSPHPGPRRGRGMGRGRFGSQYATNTAPAPPSSLTAASFGAQHQQQQPPPPPVGNFGAPMPSTLPPPPPPPQLPLPSSPTRGFAADLEEKETDKERARASLRRSISSEKARRERERRERERDKRGEKEVRWSRSVGSESGSSKKRSPAL